MDCNGIVEILFCCPHADSDGDGVVTLSEHDAFTEHVFLEADADDDGYLTFQELKQHNRGM